MSTPSIGKWVVHIGYQKTASSWLQKNLFPNLPEIEFIGKRYPDTKWCKQLGKRLLFDAPADFVAPEVQEHLATNLAGVDPEKTRLYSREGLVGYWRHGSRDMERNADRIRAVFGSPKIVLVIRNQFKLLESIYRQYLRWGGLLTMSSFLNYKTTQHVHFRLPHAEFLRVVQYYAQLFGTENLKVLPFELLAEKPQVFCDEITGFIGAAPYTLQERDKKPANVGFSDNFCRYRRVLNHFVKTPFNPDAFYPRYQEHGRGLAQAIHPEVLAQKVADLEEKLGRRRTLLTPAQRKMIAEYYAPSNRILQSYMTQDLGAYGYPV